MEKRSWAEPYKIKMVELLKMTTIEERKVAIQQAGLNTFLLKSEDVYIDLLTDSGVGAMSDVQWAGIMTGDEAYAGSRNFYHMRDTIEEYYSYKYTVPTHQGRGAENILSQILIKAGDYIPGNMYFTTTRLHQEIAGGHFVDIIIDEAHDPDSEHPFKGNVDLDKLERLVGQVGADKIPYVCIATCVNMAGGQPISLTNLQEVRSWCDKYKVLLVHDMTRVAENAFFIQQREQGYQHKSVKEIVYEICALTDAATMSAKKDALVNIGGFLAMNNKDLYEKSCELVVVYEGLHTYGGMAGRDMEALAIGIVESVQDNHMQARVGQVEYLGKLLDSEDVPIVRPYGGHAIFLNAREILPHIPQQQFPAQALAAALYVSSGIRSMERGAVSAGRDHETGKNVMPKLELVRLTIPRRVYTQAHIDVTAESVVRVMKSAHLVKGLRFTYEPKMLRFFMGRFESV
ncbi:Tryptophanase [hydrothermal vent metagenome]|uniref:Tyrosine phenol-lyase n=1 Tax=hydrothermal vent metagenome TaxID=652676 RepID=A0A3B0WB28_9ZZZZ